MSKGYKLWLLLLPLVGSSGCVDAINKVGPTVGPFHRRFDFNNSCLREWQTRRQE